MLKWGQEGGALTGTVASLLPRHTKERPREDTARRRLQARKQALAGNRAP